MRSFDELWQYTNNIYGSFSEGEARAMYKYVSELERESVVVEVGSYCGRSSSLLGQIALSEGHELSCVDIFVSGAPNVTDVEAEFRKNMPRDIVKYQLLVMESRRASKLFKDNEIDFLFIDGDHLYKGVKDDCDYWLPKLKPGSIVCFHDYYSSWDGVKQAVDERPEIKQIERADSLAVCKKLDISDKNDKI